MDSSFEIGKQVLDDSDRILLVKVNALVLFASIFIEKEILQNEPN